MTKFSSVGQSCPSLCDSMDWCMPGFPVFHHLPELAQTHVHWVSDAIQPCHPLSSPSPPTLNLSQHQGLFQWVSSLHHVARVLGFSFRVSPSNEYSGLISCRIDWFDLLPVYVISIIYNQSILSKKITLSNVSGPHLIGWRPEKQKTECGWIDAFELWCWRRLLRVPWTARRSKQSSLKKISPEYLLEGLMLKLKLQYLAILCEELTLWKRPWCWERLRAGGEGDDRGWDGCMASPTRWTCVWVRSGSWW